MVLIDIYVPSFDKSYDFQLNENVKVDVIIDEIIEMIGQKERIKLHGFSESLLLCDKLNRKVLNREKTLLDSGVINGDTLILI